MLSAAWQSIPWGHAHRRLNAAVLAVVAPDASRQFLDSACDTGARAAKPLFSHVCACVVLFCVGTTRVHALLVMHARPAAGRVCRIERAPTLRMRWVMCVSA